MTRTPRVQKILDKAAELTDAERAELLEALNETPPLVVTEEDMQRQREAVNRFLAAPTFGSGSTDTSEDG